MTEQLSINNTKLNSNILCCLITFSVCIFFLFFFFELSPVFRSKVILKELSVAMLLRHFFPHIAFDFFSPYAHLQRQTGFVVSLKELIVDSLF